MGLIATKPVFGVSDKVRFKPACSATETSYIIEILLVESFDMVLSKEANSKGADLTAQMHRLVFACVVRKPQKTGFLASRSNYITAVILVFHFLIVLRRRWCELVSLSILLT